MVRDDDDDDDDVRRSPRRRSSSTRLTRLVSGGGGGRRTAHRRRLGRLGRRRARLHLNTRRPRRTLVRVRPRAARRLSTLQVSRDNIQIHPSVRTSSLHVPRLQLSSSRAADGGGVQYISVPAGYRLMPDTRPSSSSSSLARPLIIQQPLAASSTMLDRRLGLVATTPQGFQVVRLADRKPTSSLDYHHQGEELSVSEGSDEQVLPAAAVGHWSLDGDTHQPAAAAAADGGGGGGVELVMPSTLMQLLTTNHNDHVDHASPVSAASRRRTRTLRTSSDTSPTYIILKLSAGNEHVSAGADDRQSSGDGRVKHQSGGGGGKLRRNNVRYIDLSHLLSSSSHLSVTSSPPRAVASRAAPGTSRRHRPPQRAPAVRHRHRPPTSAQQFNTQTSQHLYHQPPPQRPAASPQHQLQQQEQHGQYARDGVNLSVTSSPSNAVASRAAPGTSWQHRPSQRAAAVRHRHRPPVSAQQFNTQTSQHLYHQPPPQRPAASPQHQLQQQQQQQHGQYARDGVNNEHHHQPHHHRGRPELYDPAVILPLHVPTG